MKTLAFMEGQKITQIEMVSEEWWQGMNEMGEVGVFPGASKLEGPSIC